MARSVLSVAALKKIFPEMSFRLRDGEYRVNFKGGNEATAYYTNDVLDAMHTARAMLGEGNKHVAKNPPPDLPRRQATASRNRARMVYYTCPECEANFRAPDLKDGYKIPSHKWLGKSCPGVGMTAFRENSRKNPPRNRARKPVTLAALNAQMKAEGMPARLYKGRGYFYFGDVETNENYPSIYVYSLKQMTFDEWMEQIRDSIYNGGRGVRKNPPRSRRYLGGPVVVEVKPSYRIPIATAREKAWLVWRGSEAMPLGFVIAETRGDALSKARVHGGTIVKQISRGKLTTAIRMGVNRKLEMSHGTYE